MQIGILQCGTAPDDLRPETGDYPDMFQRLLADQGFTFRTWHVEDMAFPDSIHDAEGWLLTGSRHGVYEDHAFIAPLEDFIRRAFDAGVPMVGICFGHQIIAQALGGTVEKFDGGWAVGTQHYDFDGEKISLNAWHQDQVIAPPPMAQTVARNDFCAHAALIYPGRAYTVQAHPEFQDDFIEGLVHKRGRGKVPDTVLDAALGRLGQATSSGVIARRIGDFFRQNRAG
ncbi:type 1 glutamine amidotransferase [Paracoccus sp. p4-l81]|uniref:type 1 glutamine amidotransferase n=1 Tax=unclassified Paracoccus (in: a-proteobacteria) TaxID=2688777 RepID=UPI0035B6B853